MSVGAQLDALPDEVLEALEHLIFAAVGLTTVAIDQAAPAELTLHQWRALVVVGHVGRHRVGDVAARIGISLPSASRLLARLEERGLVTMARDEQDRRGTIVTLTPLGLEVRGAVIARRRALMAAALGEDGGSLPPDLARGLAALARAFERYT